MASNFVNVDRDTPMLLPVDLRQWVPADDIVHFVIESVESMSLQGLKVNRRGTGSRQYPPKMMVSLLIYCYANRLFSSRRIEAATYRDICVRFLTGDTHPDHDTIAAFRRENAGVIREVFVKTLVLARQMGVLKVGTVSTDGTHVLANASKHKNIGYERAVELERQLGLDIDGLMKEAEKADNAKADEGQKLPDEIARREALKEKIARARQELEERAKADLDQRKKEYDKKMSQRQERKDNDDPPTGSAPREPQARPTGQGMANMTDPDSRLMRKSRHAPYQQGYNMQAVVDAEGSMLILAAQVVQSASDTQQLEPMVAQVPPEAGEVTGVLADAGYVNIEAMKRMEGRGYDLYVAVGRNYRQDQRRYDFRPRCVLEKQAVWEKPATDPTLVSMGEKLRTASGKAMYKLRKETVEPVFGIIRQAMGFRQCLMRGLQKVQGEWSLVAVAYNFKRLWSLGLAA